MNIPQAMNTCLDLNPSYKQHLLVTKKQIEQSWMNKPVPIAIQKELQSLLMLCVTSLVQHEQEISLLEATILDYYPTPFVITYICI